MWLWAVHITGWYLAIFPGVGRDESNLTVLLIGTVLMLSSLVVLVVREHRK
jgi:hypothetical protein